MDFFKNIERQFGHPTHKAFKTWKNLSEKRLRLHEQLRFLLRCRQEGLIPSHLDSTKLGQINIYNKRNQARFQKLLNLTHRKIINIEIDDINYRIKLIDQKVRKIRPLITNTPTIIHRKFFELESQKWSRLSMKLYNEHQNKLQRLRNNRNNRIHRYLFDSKDFLLSLNSQRNYQENDNNNYNRNINNNNNMIANNNNNTNFANNNRNINNLNSMNGNRIQNITYNEIDHNNNNNDSTNKNVTIDPFSKIIANNRTNENRDQTTKKWLVNLTKINIPPHVELFLSLGHKFCHPYIKKPKELYTELSVNLNLALISFQKRNVMIREVR